MKQILTLFILTISYMLCGAQATSLTVDNQTPGWLSSKINYGDQQTVENLTITGYINSTDLSFIGTLIQKQKLSKSVDLSEAFIVGDAEREDNDISYSNIFDIQSSNPSVHIEKLALPKSISTPNPNVGVAPLRYIQVDTLVYGGNQCTTYNNALWGFRFSGGSGAKSAPKHLVLREGVTKIAAFACDNSGRYSDSIQIETVSCPPSMTSIEKGAFRDCKKLHTINLPDNIDEIGTAAFQGTSILPDTLGLPNSLKQYNTTSFPLKDKQVVVIPKSVESIDNTYSTYNNTYNQWSTHDYITNGKHYYWVMNSKIPPSVKYYYQGFLKGSTIYIPHNSYAQYSAEKLPNGGFNPFSLGQLIEIIPIENISFNQASQILFVGNSLLVKPTITPSNASNQLIYWISSNPDIANVDNTGNITALKYGQTEITATTKDGNHSASFILYVYEHVESIEIPTKLMLVIGENKNLSVLVKPEGKTNDEVIWETSDSSIATVDNKGNVKGISNGQCTITATTIDGGHTAECLVNVIQPVEAVDVTPNSLSLKVGENALLSVSILPVNANDKSVIWTSEDESIAKVDQTGNVIAMAGGKTKIFATSNYDNSVKDFCEVSAMQPVTGVLLNQNTAEITVDGSLQLVATVLPDSSTNKNVTWNSSDISVAMVSGNGIVYGIKPGQATIMATTEDGGFSALCKVIVKEGFIPISEIKLNQTSIDGNIGDSYKLAASIFPENASNKTLVWQSDNEGVASVDNDGLVKLLNSGVAMIKASATDGSGAYSECKITVNKVLVSSITLSETAKEMAVGEEFQLVATILPGNATSKNIEWKSMSETIATVDIQGVVRALKKGECEISVTACDGSGTTASCKVIVGMDSAIDDITVDNQEGVMIYSVQGLLLFKGQYIARPCLSNGVYILKTESGKTVKLIIKN